MSVEEKIIEFIKLQKGIKNAKISSTKITEDKNKDGENLLYVRALTIEKQLGNNYSNNCVYYGFDTNGNYVGCVKISVLNIIPPTHVEMEYWASKEYRNRGNISTLAKTVIKEIFKDKVFDGLKVRDNVPISNIETIMVDINKDNFASLSVARKLGFDKEGFLQKNDYYNEIEKKSSFKNIL